MIDYSKEMSQDRNVLFKKHVSQRYKFSAMEVHSQDFICLNNFQNFKWRIFCNSGDEMLNCRWHEATDDVHQCEGMI